MANVSEDQFSFINRKKTQFELIRLSLAVMGIEFAYSVETAFVSPILRELGVDNGKAIAVWAIAPVLGIMFSPLLGFLSDKCRSVFGRRRPFILTLSFGLLLGILLVPYGREIGIFFGDKPSSNRTFSESVLNRTSDENRSVSLPIFAVVITALGLVLMDFDADVCQSLTRAYLLDATMPEDHARGLSMFMILSGVGGCLGYVLGAVDWAALKIGSPVGGNVEFVFLTVALIFLVCIITTVTTFHEIPLDILQENNEKDKKKIELEVITNHPIESIVSSKQYTTVRKLIDWITHMPRSMVILYITNLFTWMGHLSYVLYFTDYVAEVVYEGDPNAEPNSRKHELFKDGVRFGCWGLATYSFSCASYSLIIERLIKKFKIKPVYIGGLSIFVIGMAILTFIKNKITIIFASITAGIGYSTLFSIPYILIAYYHTTGKLSEKAENDSNSVQNKRGLGADIAFIGSTVFVAQLILSVGLGAVVEAIGDVSITIWASALLTLASVLLGLNVVFLDL